MFSTYAKVKEIWKAIFSWLSRYPWCWGIELVENVWALFSYWEVKMLEISHLICLALGSSERHISIQNLKELDIWIIPLIYPTLYLFIDDDVEQPRGTFSWRDTISYLMGRWQTWMRWLTIKRISMVHQYKRW